MQLWIVTPLLALALLVAGCGSSNSSSTSSSGTPGSASHHCGIITDAKIGAHIGIAYIAFHRYLYKPWKDGKFAKGVAGRKTAIVKGVVAALVGIHEAKVAVRELRGCGAGNALSGLVSSAESKLTGLKGGASSGSVSNTQLNSTISGLANTYTQMQSAR